MSEIKREQLLDAGLELLSEKTFSEISMDLVAEKSGLSKPMIYYYFTNKEGYYRALAGHLLKLGSRTIGKMFLPDLPLRENLKHYVRRRLEFIEDHPGLSRAYLFMLYDPNIGLYLDDLRGEFDRIRNDVIDPIFDEALANGEIDPSTDRYLTFMMINSTLIGHTIKKIHGIKVMDTIDPMGMIDILFDGIGTGSTEGDSE